MAKLLLITLFNEGLWFLSSACLNNVVQYGMPAEYVE